MEKCDLNLDAFMREDVCVVEKSNLYDGLLGEIEAEDIQNRLKEKLKDSREFLKDEIPKSESKSGIFGKKFSVSLSVIKDIGSAAILNSRRASYQIIQMDSADDDRYSFVNMISNKHCTSEFPSFVN